MDGTSSRPTPLTRLAVPTRPTSRLGRFEVLAYAAVCSRHPRCCSQSLRAILVVTRRPDRGHNSPTHSRRPTTPGAQPLPAPNHCRRPTTPPAQVLPLPHHYYCAGCSCTPCSFHIAPHLHPRSDPRFVVFFDPGHGSQPWWPWWRSYCWCWWWKQRRRQRQRWWRGPHGSVPSPPPLIEFARSTIVSRCPRRRSLSGLRLGSRRLGDCLSLRPCRLR